MTDEAKRLVDALREDAEWAQANEWEAPITLGDNLTAAADMIEKLSANLDSDERQYGRIAFATLVDEGMKLEAERDAWKLRCEAAERDIKRMLTMGNFATCFFCEAMTTKFCPGKMFEIYQDCNSWANWIGPCAENGGAEDGNCADFD